MANLETIEASEIAAIHRQHLPNAMNIHACRQPGVVDLYTLNMVYDKQRSPTIVDLAAVGKKFEVPLDHACQPIRLRDTQTEAVFIEWTGGGIPEFAQRLRSVAEPNALTDQYVKRVPDHGC